MNVQGRFALLNAAVLWASLSFGSPALAQDERNHARETPHREAPRAPAARPPLAAPAHPAVDGRGQVLDQRYNHGRYYPPSGTVIASLPSGYRPVFRGGERYYFNAGVWYAPRGSGFVVIAPPPGLIISVLPPYYTTVWYGGVPYYYADSVYYTWQPDQNAYVVVDAPPNADQAPSAPPAPDPSQSTSAQNDLIIYPKNGQTADQQSADQYECNNWARGQTGFDPTEPSGGVQGDVDRARNNYDRAMTACLEGRGYQVN